MKWPLLVAALSLAGCGSEGTLVVQVRTDLLPRSELGSVEVELLSGEGGVTSRDATEDVDWGLGVRVAELTGLASGEHRVQVRALGPDGETIVERPVTVTLTSGVYVVTVLLTRDCAGVMCPDAGDARATACLGGRCVPEGCSEETPDLCPMRECELPSDCADRGSDCANVGCTPSGSCFVEPDHAMCGPDICSVDEGCVSDCQPGRVVWEMGYGAGVEGLRDVIQLVGGEIAALGLQDSPPRGRQTALLVLNDDGSSLQTIDVGFSIEGRRMALDEAGRLTIVATGSSGLCHIALRDDRGGERRSISFGVSPCVVNHVIGASGVSAVLVGSSGGRAALWHIRSDGVITSALETGDSMRELQSVLAETGNFVAAGVRRHADGETPFVRFYDASFVFRSVTDVTTPSWQELRIVGMRKVAEAVELFGAVSDDGLTYRRLRVSLTGTVELGTPVETGVDVRVEDIVFIPDDGYAIAETRRVGTRKAISVTRWDESHRLRWMFVQMGSENTRAAAITRTRDGDLVVVGGTGEGENEWYALRLSDPACP